MPEMATCDSAVIMYYHTPGNPRFFNMVKVKDKEWLSLISNDVKGDAVYVTYFSRNDDCQSFSFIKTGVKYFTNMSSETKELLDKLQRDAKEPQPVSQ